MMMKNYPVVWLLTLTIVSCAARYEIPSDWRDSSKYNPERPQIRTEQTCPGIVFEKIEFGRIDHRFSVRYDPDPETGQMIPNFPDFEYYEYIHGGKNELLLVYLNWILYGLSYDNIFKNVRTEEMYVRPENPNNTLEINYYLRISDYLIDSHTFGRMDEFYGRVDMGDEFTDNRFIFHAIPPKQKDVVTGCCMIFSTLSYDIFSVPYHKLRRTTKIELSQNNTDENSENIIPVTEVEVVTDYLSTEMPSEKKIVFGSRDYFIEIGRELAIKLRQQMISQGLCSK